MIGYLVYEKYRSRASDVRISAVSVGHLTLSTYLVFIGLITIAGSWEASETRKEYNVDLHRNWEADIGDILFFPFYFTETSKLLDYLNSYAREKTTWKYK